MSTKDNALRMAIKCLEHQIYIAPNVTMIKTIEACKAALSDNETSSSSDAVTLPDGWVAVPVEPTDEMLVAGGYTLLTGVQDRPELSWADESKLAYKAMSQAAPILNEKG